MKRFRIIFIQNLKSTQNIIHTWICVQHLSIQAKEIILIGYAGNGLFLYLKETLKTKTESIQHFNYLNLKIYKIKTNVKQITKNNLLISALQINTYLVPYLYEPNETTSLKKTNIRKNLLEDMLYNFNKIILCCRRHSFG